MNEKLLKLTNLGQYVNDGEKWSRKNCFEIPTGKMLIEFVIWGKI
jgi:hypothetical protein